MIANGMDSPPRDGAPRPVAASVAAASVAAPAIRGSIWTIGGYAVSNLLRFGSNLILARLLFPAAFGEMALVFVFIQGLQMFSDVGTGPAIVQNPRENDAKFLNTAWTIQCARGAILWLASWAIGWPVALFYGQPTLRWLIPAAGLTALLGGFESTSVHTVQRDLRLERLTILELTSQVVGIMVTVLLALGDRWLYGPNHPSAVWAIVGGTFAGSAVRLVLSHTFLPGVRNRLHLNREAMKHLFGFGRWVFVSTLLTFLAAQLDRLMLGKMIPIAFFGVYSIASQFTALPTAAVMKLVGYVLFPAYSRSVSRDDFRELFWRGRWPMLLGGAAVVSALMACGPFLMPVLYDPRYLEGGWIIQYLAAAAWFQILEYTNVAALLAKGRLRWMAAGSAAKVASMAIMIPVGFHLGGFRGALVGAVASEVPKYLISAIAVAAAGLQGFGRDALLTGAIACISIAGGAGGRMVLASGAGAVLPLLASAGVAALPWAAVALWYLSRLKLARAAQAAN